VGRPRSTSCNKCGLSRAEHPGAFYVVGTYTNGDTRLSMSCRACQDGYSRDWYAENRSRAIASRTAYYRQCRATDPTRFKGYAAAHYARNTEAIRAERREASRSRRAKARDANACWYAADTYALIVAADPCVYCDAPSEHLDHIVPLVGGGEHSWENFAPTCALCNQRKNAKSMLEFLLVRVEQAVA
jgi:5-methylcytosine-specific restriction endonuclease McrA